MDEARDEAFHKVVKQVFSNWFALKLAVEHSMGGPDSQRTALNCVDRIAYYCLCQPNVEVEDIEDALENALDMDFETICEDNSPKEIAVILYKFVQLFKANNVAELELEYQKLPAEQQWLYLTRPQNAPRPVVESSSDSDDEDEEEAPPPTSCEAALEQWTEVRTRRKK